mgnify:CR=1 FL=1
MATVSLERVSANSKYGASVTDVDVDDGSTFDGRYIEGQHITRIAERYDLLGKRYLPFFWLIRPFARHCP